MTPQERKVIELALEAFEGFIPYLPLKDEAQCNRYDKAITAIKEALSEPEQEPVGKFAKFTDNIWREVTDGSAEVPLYTTPQRTWVDLTDEDRSMLIRTLKWSKDLLLIAGHDEELSDVQDCLMILRKAQEK